MKAEAPGKLILSGEHSVVYGAPALAIPVARKANVSFVSDNSARLRICSDFLGEFSCSLLQLQDISQQLDQNFSDFLKQQCSISDVLASPFELLLYTLAQQGFNHSGILTVKSDIPLGSGMGSSAAVICALIKLSEQLTERPLALFERLNRVRHCERLQHGRGSAVDAAAVVYGRAVRVLRDAVTELPMHLGSDWYLWNSGKPRSSTGETVSAVRHHFGNSSIWEEFSEVTSGFEHALLEQNKHLVLQRIQLNHKLLKRIGVVPDATADMIAAIERSGGAAKICGAGSAAGVTGGMVLVYLPDTPATSIEQQLNISLEPVIQAEEQT